MIAMLLVLDTSVWSGKGSLILNLSSRNSNYPFSGIRCAGNFPNRVCGSMHRCPLSATQVSLEEMHLTTTVNMCKHRCIDAHACVHAHSLTHTLTHTPTHPSLLLHMVNR